MKADKLHVLLLWSPDVDAWVPASRTFKTVEDAVKEFVEVYEPWYKLHRIVPIADPGKP